jgi:hypothetical protein
MGAGATGLWPASQPASLEVWRSNHSPRRPHKTARPMQGKTQQELDSADSALHCLLRAVCP